MTISRKYRSDRMFKRPHIKGNVFTYTMSGQYKSFDGNCYAQLFAKNSFLVDAYTMKKKSLAGQLLGYFISNFRVVDHLVCYRSKDQTSKGTNFMKEIQKQGIDLHVTKKDRHNQSKVEGVIR